MAKRKTKKIPATEILLRELLDEVRAMHMTIKASAAAKWYWGHSQIRPDSPRFTGDVW